jgi:hypothetical protein
MSTLPETLLLFALHDDRGTVHSAAFLALEPALRGSVLSELKLRGHLQVRNTTVDGAPNGEIRWHPSPPPRPREAYLRDAMDVLSGLEAPAPVGRWLALLAKGLPDLRARVSSALERRGILVSTERELPSRTVTPAVTYPLSNPTAERDLRDEVVRALDEGDAVSPRLGILVGLTVACHLDAVVFGDRAEEADARATWVADRDAILRAVVEVVAQAEGQW